MVIEWKIKEPILEGKLNPLVAKIEMTM
jgi:hypothetical protein